MMITQNKHPLLAIRDLRTSFGTDRGLIAAVDGVSLDIPHGKTVALVGESGCGKSTVALSILRLIPQPPGNISSGQILLDHSKNFRPSNPSPKHKRRVQDHASDPPLPHGRGSDIESRGSHIESHGSDIESHESDIENGYPIDLLQLNEQEMQTIRGGQIAMIFQEPLTSLNPVYTVGAQIVEAIELHQPLRGAASWNKVIEMMDRVGITDPHDRALDYPHQLSGGMQQRVMIAMALSCEPSLLIADEPTTALDVTIQSHILDLLRSMQQENGMSLLFITHDLGVVAQMADEVYVMYAGKIVEHAPVAELFGHPLHPYTKGLLRCTPRVTQNRSMHRLEVIPGSVPDLSSLPSGCSFHPRCDLTIRQAKNSSRQAESINLDDSETTPHSESTPIGTLRQSKTKILKRCVHSYDDEPSGIPRLSEATPGHFVACWEI